MVPHHDTVTVGASVTLHASLAWLGSSDTPTTSGPSFVHGQTRAGICGDLSGPAQHPPTEYVNLRIVVARRAADSKRGKELPMSTSPQHVVDRQLVVYEHWKSKQRRAIADLITDELIEEHRIKPLGQHSEKLERVLQYFRRQPQTGKYLGVMTSPWREYRIGVIAGDRGAPVRILDSPIFATEDAVLHGIFERRISDLREELS